MDKFLREETCVVIGNGPSLRGFDLHRLEGYATLGMNAAYRYWDRIGWYPKYYACLDDQVIQSHHVEIERLYRDGLVEKLFLHRSFFDHHPHRVGNPDFVIFDQTSRHWHPRNAKPLGLPPLFDRPAFRISDTSKITTGSHSVRYVADLGYKQILLMGIDLRYVEILPEAEKTQGVGLKMSKTPKKNPNYFFDNYQQAGDLYNIPNPAAHQGDLHPRAFELIAKDFEANDVGCSVFNTNPESILSDRNIFPLLPIDKALGDSRLGSVFVPCNVREMPDVLANFKVWASAEFSPSIGVEMAQRPSLVFVFNNAEGRAYQDEIKKAFADANMGRFFRGLAFEYLQLEGKTDQYQRDYTVTVGDEGYKSGPNNQFFRSMDCMAKYGRYAFLMEVDCVPLRRGWLDSLQSVIDGSEDFWILGSAYRGGEVLSKANQRHLNGNAIYAAGDPAFQDFLQDFWEPQTWNMIKNVDKRLAYDCVLEILFDDEALQDVDRLGLWKSVAHRFRYTDWIQNISAASDLKATNEMLMPHLRETFPMTSMLHNRVAQKYVAEQAEAGQLEARRPVPPDQTLHRRPKLLVFDMTPTGNGSATGEIKANFLEDWNEADLLQICKHGQDGVSVLHRKDGKYINTAASTQEAQKAIDGFDADVVLYRPVPNTQTLHALAMSEIKRLNKPVITWLMDDWPARMQIEEPQAWGAMRTDLGALLKKSVTNLSICEKMSAAFAARYGTALRPLANGVDPADWTPVPRPDRKTFIIRYAGGIAPDMNRKSLLRVAEAIDGLARSGMDIKFEISTQSWWMKECEPLFAGFPSTTMELANKTTTAYRRWISEADLLLIAYNFDEESLLYTQFSMANKMPECLASGVATLAHGPKAAATIEYLDAGDLAQVVTEPDVAALAKAIKELQSNADLRAQLGALGRARALEKHNIHQLRQSFETLVTQAAFGATDAVPSVAGKSIPVQNLEPVIAHNLEIEASSDNVTALRAALLKLSSEILLGNRNATTLDAQEDIPNLVELAEKRLGADDPTLKHFHSVRRLNRAITL